MKIHLTLHFAIFLFMTGHAQSYKVIMMADATGGNCPNCKDAIMTQQAANSLNQAYETEKSFRKQYGMIPSIYILKPSEAAVIIEYTEKVGNCSCKKKNGIDSRHTR